MILHLRIDKSDTHVHMSLFVNGALAGKLCMTPEESRAFIATLRLGAFTFKLSETELNFATQ